jgi:zinc/manganese transport system substrate-binding protein
MKYTITLFIVLSLMVIMPFNSVIGVAQYIHVLRIVVTFSSLLPDVEQVALPTDIVEYIVPIGVDPHTYSLTRDDIDKLMEADVIISTAHTGFEEKIRELKNEGVIKGVLIEIPKIKGIKIKTNPVTGRPNLHMPIYDPYNYKVFIENITHTFAKLNPIYRDRYWRKGNETISIVNSLIKRTPKLNMSAVLETPALQYAVEWLGVRVKYLLIREHGVSPTPKDINMVVAGLENGTINLVVVSSPVVSRAGEYLIEHAEKRNIPILYVPSPVSPGSIIHKLENISQQVIEILHGFREGRGVKPPSSPGICLETTSEIIGLILMALTIAYLAVGRRV